MKEIVYSLFCLLTAIIGYHIHNSIYLSIIDFFFAPIVWIKWLAYHEVNMTIINEALTPLFTKIQSK